MVTVGIDIGGMSFKVGLVDDEGKILKKYSIPVDYSLSQEDMVRNLGRSVDEFLKKEQIALGEARGIGIGCPGAINPIKGTCDYSPNLKWNKLDVCGIINKETGLNCRISNDANVACLGEQKFGAAKGYKDVVLITLGTGVGGGVVIDGRLFEGNQGKGTELGHEVICRGGRKCSCGRRGCLEAYASATALLKDTKRAMAKDKKSLMWDYCEGKIKNVTGLTSFECAKKGDKTANAVIDNYVSWLCTGLLNICNIFRPECIVLGGGISNQKDFFLNKVKKCMEDNHYGFGGDVSPKVDIVISNLRNDAGVIGAASLFLE